MVTKREMAFQQVETHANILMIPKITFNLYFELQSQLFCTDDDNQWPSLTAPVSVMLKLLDMKSVLFSDVESKPSPQILPR